MRMSKAELANSKTPNSQPPVWVAADKGYTSILSSLIKVGADVNQPDNRAMLPVTIAKRRGYDDVVKLLCEHGADIESYSHYFYYTFPLQDYHRLAKIAQPICRKGFQPLWWL